MEWLNVLIPIISGVVGANVAGSAMKKFDLGTVGNSIVGLLGGAAGALITSMLGGGDPGASGFPAATQAGGVDMGSIVASIVGGGAGGGVLMSLVGAIRNKFGKGA